MVFSVFRRRNNVPSRANVLRRAVAVVVFTAHTLCAKVRYRFVAVLAIGMLGVTSISYGQGVVRIPTPVEVEAPREPSGGYPPIGGTPFPWSGPSGSPSGPSGGGGTGGSSGGNGGGSPDPGRATEPALVQCPVSCSCFYYTGLSYSPALPGAACQEPKYGYYEATLTRHFIVNATNCNQVDKNEVCRGSTGYTGYSVVAYQITFPHCGRPQTRVEIGADSDGGTAPSSFGPVATGSSCNGGQSSSSPPSQPVLPPPPPLPGPPLP